ncbi:hypothetical protein Tco_1030670 [Tanacetum coccineum]|uniref:Integrase, catalytic region, zinc finger, CCHC-type, peptidase aspartic, catalytic n=1 Tax=Tanacetum coccineum TaxID=301880 RepID=A0ABQ5G7L2_9ASTR
MSNPTSKPSDASPVKIEAPKELPKVSLVNESLKKLKFHLAWFDNVVKIRTTPDAHIEGMFKQELEPLAPRLLQNREAHINYLKYTREQAYILQGIVEQAKAKQPLDKELDFACCPDCTLVYGLRMNDKIARIMGYGDYQLGNIVISSVYYVEGLGHNLFYVGQFCDADLEVAFQKKLALFVI